MKRLMIVLLLAFSTTSAAQSGESLALTVEISAGWTFPIGELADVSDGGPSVRLAGLYPTSWGAVLAWSGYTDHRGLSFELPPGAVGFAGGKIDAQDVPLLGGARIERGRARIDLTAGVLWRRLKLGALDVAGTSIDPAVAVHAGLEIRGGSETAGGGLSAGGGLVIARNDWFYLSAGLSWQF